MFTILRGLTDPALHKLQLRGISWDSEVHLGKAGPCPPHMPTMKLPLIYTLDLRVDLEVVLTGHPCACLNPMLIKFLFKMKYYRVAQQTLLDIQCKRGQPSRSRCLPD